MFKSGFVTILGKPNVGKSTLMNAMIGEKIAITSYKPQTTRNKITSILTEDDFQVVFLDTPGIHKPKTKLGEYMMKEVKNAAKDVDAILLLTEPKEKLSILEEHVELIRNKKIPAILVINKVDTINNEELIEYIGTVSKIYNFADIVPVSAIKNKNVDKLKEIIVSHLNEGPKYYDEDMITDQPERDIVAEIIREKALLFLQQEIPHGIAVMIESMKEGENLTKISAVIYCERESHKGMIIGKQGAMLKKIGTRARVEMERLLDTKVFLEMHVKVKDHWRDSENLIKSFGYKEEK